MTLTGAMLLLSLLASGLCLAAITLHILGKTAEQRKDRKSADLLRNLSCFFTLFGVIGWICAGTLLFAAIAQAKH